MKIKAKSKFDYKTMKAFVRASFSRKHDPLKKLLIYCLTFVILAAVVLLEMHLVGSSLPLRLVLYVSIAAILLELYMYFLAPRIRYNALAKLKGCTHEFLFTEDYMQINSSDSGFSGESRIKYTVLTKAVETSKYMYIFQDKNHAFIVDKATFSDGTPQQLQEKLQSILGKEYVIYKY